MEYSKSVLEDHQFEGSEFTNCPPETFATGTSKAIRPPIVYVFQ